MKEKNRKYKLIEIIVLIIAIIIFLFCFWAYSEARKLKVKGEVDVDVIPSMEGVNIVFSPISDLSKEEDKNNEIVGVSNSDNVAGTATIINTKKGTVTNLQARFTSPGQEVSYTLYSHNIG